MEVSSIKHEKQRYKKGRPGNRSKKIGKRKTVKNIKESERREWYRMNGIRTIIRKYITQLNMEKPKIYSGNKVQKSKIKRLWCNEQGHIIKITKE